MKDIWFLIVFALAMICYLVLVPLMFKAKWKSIGRCEGIRIGYDKAISEMKEMEKLRRDGRPWGSVTFGDGRHVELH